MMQKWLDCVVEVAQLEKQKVWGTASPLLHISSIRLACDGSTITTSQDLASIAFTFTYILLS